ncbi:hypothetical protein OBBRIDRAFT_766364 [Obba rivulosa]|uniref:Uncharacterized protein n=1 Tax=Obba rivulosa TaxID=1052685 RepID=A0A8E2DUQ7_9APHY|nr:hypothetical protein OBBRIDRAFT_766364 [Obba rivulosa]
MADPRQRVPLQPSQSYSGPSNTSAPPRTLKRRLTNPSVEPTPFTPPAAFRPRTFQPSGHSESCHSTHPHTRTVVSRMAYDQEKPLDVCQDDPDATFIHPPFKDFPGAENYPGGLTYAILAVHKEWFLDPLDFKYAVDVSDANPNPHAITYPSELEPPRGWWGIAEAFPEGCQEPTLRCTFCRRKYSGRNAKSMWRRHVYEKHKIGMPNRRDTHISERKGRGSNKENRDKREGGTRSKRKKASRDSGDEREPPDAYPPRPGYHDENEPPSISRAPALLRDDSPPSNELGFSASMNASSTPPATPGCSPKKRSIFPTPAKLVPESPYNPLQTPSFRHSPARLPSDQPWRFPSPSHPLHSNAHELSLCMLVRGEASPNVSGLDVSPVVIVPASERKKRSIFSSPFVPQSSPMKEGPLDFDILDKLSDFPRPSPRRLFYDSPGPSRKLERSSLMQRTIAESPLRRELLTHEEKSVAETGVASTSALSFSPGFKRSISSPALMGPIDLQGDDPFAGDLLPAWIDLDGNANDSSFEHSPPPQSDVEESPVVRSTQPPSQSRTQYQLMQSSGSSSSKGSISGLFSMSAGLMDAFLSGGKSARTKEHAHDVANSDDSMDADVGRALGSPVQVGKKTRREPLSFDAMDEGDVDMMLQPRKRRRTISGRE